jgi:hypothetical protein
VLGHSPGVGEGAAEEHLDVRVEAAELIAGPAHQRVVYRRVHAEQDLPAFAHEYREPAFTTGDGGCSPQSTT